MTATHYPQARSSRPPRRRWKPLLQAALGVGVLLPAIPSMAQANLPAVNLGDSTFQDGVAGPGGMIQITLSHQDADRIRNGAGAPLASPRRVRSTAALVQAAWLSERRFLGAWWGAEVIVPVVQVDLDLGSGVSASTLAVGDVFVSPLLLQWPATTLFGRPYWQRLNLNATMPTGDYSPAKLSVGSNAWRFNPHYAFTWEADENWEISGRVHYLWTGRNDDPPPALNARSVQPGEAIHLNAAVSRRWGEGGRLGLSGYALAQIEDDRIDGRRRTGGRERVLGLGPAASWKSGAHTWHGAFYWETSARDRPEGVRASLRYARTF